MATDNFVSKDELIEQLHGLAERRETGLVTIVTDTRHAVMLKLADGDIVGTHCRTRDIGEAIGVLLECGSVRFAYAPAPSDAVSGHRSAIMPLSTFVELISPLVRTDPLRSQGPAPGAAAPAGLGGLGADVRKGLETLAVEIMGPIARVVVDDAFAESQSLGEAVESIAQSIPDAKAAERFVREARRRLPDRL